jgi:ABC-2 type transport system permease protein
MAAAEMATSGAMAAAVRSGPAHWLRAYLLMTRRELTTMRMLFVLVVFVQVVIGAGFIVGFGLLLGEEVPPIVTMYLSTGVPTVTLITVGMVLGPQLIGNQKIAGTYDFMWSLPVPRTAAAAGWFTVSAAIAIPGMIVAVLAAWWRFDLDLALSPTIVPAVLLVLLTGTIIGFAMAHAISNPMVTLLITQVLIFFILGFSPISFPAEQLPNWLAAAHRVLPFAHMANVVRDELADGLTTGVGMSYAVLSAWAAAALLAATPSLGRRG